MNQRKIKEHIFEIIFEQFAKGQRLQSYDAYRLERELDSHRHCAGDDHHHERKQVLSKKEQAQKELQQLAKKMEQMEATRAQKKQQARYMDFDAKHKKEK